MARKGLVYFCFLGVASLLFGLAALLTSYLDHDVVGLGLLRFVVVFLGVGCAIGTWATAVTIASVHRKTWALYVTVSIVVAASVTLASLCCRMPPARL